MLQAIYQGKTDQSLPPSRLRHRSKHAGWHFTSTENHWSDLPSMKALVSKIIEPYRKCTVEKLGLPAEQKILWLIDVWSVHVSEAFRSWMKQHFANILILYIPPNCTSKLQPQDVAVQKPFKGAVQAAFRAFQRRRYEQALLDGMPLHLTLMLTFSCRWIANTQLHALFASQGTGAVNVRNADMAMY
jgi:hypothetical protein